MQCATAYKKLIRQKFNCYRSFCGSRTNAMISDNTIPNAIIKFGSKTLKVSKNRPKVIISQHIGDRAYMCVGHPLNIQLQRKINHL